MTSASRLEIARRRARDRRRRITVQVAEVFNTRRDALVMPVEFGEMSHVA